LSEIRGIQQQMIDRGIAALKAGDFQTAGQIAETAIARDPNDLAGLALLGKLHLDLRNYGTALTVCRMALQVAQAAGCITAEQWYNVSVACRKTWQKAPALEALDNAAALCGPDDPDIPLAYSSYWLTYGDPAKAEWYARRAVELDPESAMGHTNLGMALLCLDRWDEAWPHLERRKALARWTRPADRFPQWDGQKVGTLIVHGEQGLGDEIQHYSLLSRIADRADRIVVECAERLVPLLRRSLGCEVYGSLAEAERNGSLEGAHIVAVASLPLHAGATRENCADNAYLLPDPLRAIHWRARLAGLAGDRPIIGVAWRGGTYENHEVLRNPPRELFKRLSPERYCLVSVQYTDGAASQAAEMGMLHFQQAIDDLDEQAALIKACDKLVTVAQTAMHIGGALGTETLALIGQYPKWDCGQSGESVPWWKSVKAIRQRDDDWDGVFDRLLRELGEQPSARKVERFGSVLGAPTTVDLSEINILGGSDAAAPAIRAAQ
jgi:Tfp pilus assembly protein PilF